MPVILDIDLTTVLDMTKAINIAEHKIGKSIWHLQDSDRILKRGPNVKVSEADALRFVASSTDVPVPEVFGAYEKDGFGNIFMSRVIGKPLYNVLHILDEVQMEMVTKQLSGFVSSWMALRGDFFGSMGGSKACRDVFFQHLPAVNMPNREYGPFRTRTEYCDGLIGALQNSRPRGQFDANDAQLIERIQRLGDGCAVFCHGDLTPDNILVDDEMNVVAIVDMGVSGFSIPEREYFEAKSRARNPVWSSMIDRIIPKIPDDTYALLLELEQELVRYSGL
jgi:tRNA A-37 threonylcarbamoyl transferase component Bud32